MDTSNKSKQFISLSNVSFSTENNNNKPARANGNAGAGPPPPVLTDNEVIGRMLRELRVAKEDKSFAFKRKPLDAHRLYRQQMRSELTLRMRHAAVLEATHDPVALVDASRQVYSDFCRQNLSQPVDVSQVKSVSVAIYLLILV